MKKMTPNLSITICRILFIWIPICLSLVCIAQTDPLTNEQWIRLGDQAVQAADSILEYEAHIAQLEQASTYYKQGGAVEKAIQIYSFKASWAMVYEHDKAFYTFTEQGMQQVATLSAPSDTLLAEFYDLKAYALIGQDSLTKASHYIQQALQLLPSNPPLDLWRACLETLSLIYELQNDPKLEAILLEELSILQTCDQATCPDCRMLAIDIYGDLVDYYLDIDDLTRAYEYGRQIEGLLQPFESVPPKYILDMINGYYILGRVYWNLDQEQKMIRVLQPVITSTENYPNVFPPLADVHKLLLDAYHNQGDLKLSNHHLEQIRQHQSPYLLPHSYNQMRNSLDISSKYLNKGWYKQAFDLCQTTLNAYSQWTRLAWHGFNSAEYLRIDLYVALIDCAFLLEQDSIASHYLTLLAPLSKQIGYRTQESYYYWGDLADKQGKKSKALSYYQQAIAKAKERHGSYSFIMNNLYSSIAYILEDQKDYSSSLVYYQQALMCYSHTFRTTDWTKNPRLEEIDNYEEAASILIDKAYALAIMDVENVVQLQQALATTDLAISALDRFRKQTVLKATQTDIVEKAAEAYEQAIELSYGLYYLTQEKRYLQQAFQYAEKSKAAILLGEVQANKTLLSPRFLSNNLRQQEILAQEKYWGCQKQLEEAKAKQDSSKIAIWQREATNALAAFLKVKNIVKEKHKEYYNLNYEIKTATITTLQQQLQQLDQQYDQQHAIVNYIVGDYESYLFFLTATDYKVHSLASADSLVTLLTPLKDSLQTNHAKGDELTIQTYIQLAHTAYQALLGPIDKQLEAIQHLLVIPSQQISYLPFEALVTELPKATAHSFADHHVSYLLNQCAVSYAYSATLWLEQMEKQVTKQAAYMGFAPQFDDEKITALRQCLGDDKYSKLDHTETEVKDIQMLLGGQIYTQEQATKSNFLAEAPNHQIIHLATHACVNDVEPMFNQIQFTDTALHAYELFGQSLAADLVVLSACQTGTGKLAKGEGVMSLSRGFTSAGCPSLVHSLWKASDTITKNIFVDFYDHLKQGYTKPEALRQAKLAVLQDSELGSTLKHPFYWATFVQQGNISPLSLSSPSPISWTWGMVSIGLLGLVLGLTKLVATKLG